MERKKIDRSIFVQRDKKDETIIRNPGQINGNPFCANRLTNCKVIVHDFCDSMTFDNCDNCTFSLAAVRGSIFVRTCKNCDFVMVCGQFRCKNCTNCDFFLQVKTGPVIESSQDLRIGCALISYPELPEQMAKASLDPCLNLWYDIHDFTPSEKPNYVLKPGDRLLQDVEDLNLIYSYGPSPDTESVKMIVNIGKLKELALLAVTGKVKIAKTERRTDDIICYIKLKEGELIPDEVKELDYICWE